MAKQVINIGSVPDDGTGDTIRDSFDKVNDNFTEIYDTASFASNNITVANTVIIGNSSVNTTVNSTFISTPQSNTSNVNVVNRVLIGNSTINAVANSSSLKLSNSTLDFTLTLPTLVQKESKRHILTANSNWVETGNVEWLAQFTNAITRTISSKFQDIVSVKDFGATGDGSTDDTTAVQNAINYSVNNRRKLFLPRGLYKITSNLSTPTANGSSQYAFGIEGEGKNWISVLWFTGANVTEGLTIYDPVRTTNAYVYWGKYNNFGMYFSNSALGGFQIKYASHPSIEHIYINGASKGLYVEDCNKPYIENNLIINSGNSTFPQVTLNRNTVANFNSNYLATSAGSRAGIEVDRCSATTLYNNAIESCGVLIRIACNTNDNDRCDNILLIANNLENTNTYYVEIGSSFTNAYSIYGCVSIGNKGSESTSTTNRIGYYLNRTVDFYSNKDTLNVNGSISNSAMYYISDTNSLYTIIEPNRAYGGATYPWVVVGGTQDIKASPFYRYASHEQTDFATTVSRTANSVVDNRISSTQGGLYQNIFVSSPSGVVSIDAMYAPKHGDIITITATDANCRISHLGTANSSAGQANFYNSNLDTLTLTTTQTVSYVYNSNNGRFIQISYPGIGIINSLTLGNSTVNSTTNATHHRVNSLYTITNDAAQTLLHIAANNNIGISTNTPNTRLHVNGSGLITGNMWIGDNQRGYWIDDFNSFLYGIGKNTSGNGAYLALYSYGAKVYITNTGNMGIGNTAPTHKLSVVGDMLVNTSISIGNSTINTTANSTHLRVSSANVSTNTLFLGSSTVASNGYTFLPNGIKMNWGTVTVNSSSGNATFSSAYTTLYSVIATGNTADTTYEAAVISSNTTTAVIRTANATSSTVNWIAIGV